MSKKKVMAIHDFQNCHTIFARQNSNALIAFLHLFKLTRPLNLVIVFITMLVVRYAVLFPLMQKASIGMRFHLSTFSFLLLILSALAITAAGNVINDYFDQKVDRINKPERVLVGKTVKRRVAILLHQSLSVFGLLLVLITSLRTGYFWPILIPIVIITVLWWYSPVLKKKLFIGNLTVAVCTACVPFWAAVFDIHELKTHYSDLLVEPETFFNVMWIWITIISGFAFIITLVREAIKDLEDMSGDKEGDYHTIPLVYGVQKTKNYVFFLLIFFLLLSLAGIILLHNQSNLLYYGLLLFVPTCFTAWSIHKAQNQKDYHMCSYYLKFIIVAGLFMVMQIL